jgi:hypothetical protein
VEKETPLREWLNMDSKLCIYEYDFGDSWDHAVLLEKILPTEASVTYPRCIAGKRACPPEDSGGIGGYEEKLEILNHPRRKYYKEVRNWMGDFDPEHFDLKEIEFLDTYEHDYERWAEEAE